TSDAGMSACNSVDETNVVGRALPFHRTSEVSTKPVPATTSVNAPEPASTLGGFNEASDGAGFGAMMVNSSASDSPPPGAGVKSVIYAVPACAMSAAGLFAAIEVGEMNGVGRGAP